MTHPSTIDSKDPMASGQMFVSDPLCPCLPYHLKLQHNLVNRVRFLGLKLHTKHKSIACNMQDVAEFTTTCERYVGTESGGMDQAISMMGMPQIAKLIQFNPVSC